MVGLKFFSDSIFLSTHMEGFDMIKRLKNKICEDVSGASAQLINQNHQQLAVSCFITINKVRTFGNLIT